MSPTIVNKKDCLRLAHEFEKSYETLELVFHILLKVIGIDHLKFNICNLHISILEGSHQDQDLITAGQNLSYSGLFLKDHPPR